MRHGKKLNHLSRKSEHRKAMMSNLASSLVLNKRIYTTLPKAKALRKYVEPLITKSKSDNTHSRREAFKHLMQKEAVKELFITVADKVGERPGGYTRILKMGPRLGDNAEKAMMELVDFNENLLEDKQKSKGRRRRGSRRRRGGKKQDQESQQVATAEATEATTEQAEEQEEETKEDQVEEASEEQADTAVEEEKTAKAEEETATEEEDTSADESREDENKKSDESGEDEDDQQNKSE